MKKDRVILAYGRKWDRRLSEKTGFKDIPKKEEGRRSGVYVLYNKKRVVYIGKSVKHKKSLRGRIGEHITDKLKNKWDSYSWFITRKKYTSDLEGLLHNIFWKIDDVEDNEVKAGIKARRYYQKSQLRILGDE